LAKYRDYTNYGPSWSMSDNVNVNWLVPPENHDRKQIGNAASNPSGMRIPATIVMFAVLVSWSVAQTNGIVRGIVLDESGNPVPHALVYTDKVQSATILKRLDMNTDDSGRFEFQHLENGVYEVWAQKLEAGYRSTYHDIFNPNPPLRCTLTPDNPEANVSVRFAPKAAVITGWVTDAGTGEHLSPHLKITSVAHQGYEHTAGGTRFKFRVLIASDTPVLLEAWADGHKHWFNGSSSQSKPLQLRPGEILDLNIVVKRSAQRGRP
jgi:hypothetical protein